MSIKVERLKQSREKLGWSQRELARQCGIGEVLVFRYESAHSVPSTKHLITIAQTLNVSIDYLTGLTDSPKGQIGDNPLSAEEKEIVETFRRDGWKGINRLVGEQIFK